MWPRGVGVPARAAPLALAWRLLARGRLGLGLGRRLLGLPRAVAVGLLVAHGVEAGLERGHEVGDRLLVLLGGRLDGDLLAGGLALDEVENVLAVGVVVLGRVEGAR